MRNVLQNKWFVIPKPLLKPSLRIFCFSYAGGSAATYFPWIKYIDDNIEVVAIQLPGRATRFNEPLIDNMQSLINQLIDFSLFITSCPYILFGHSLGGRIAFELVRNLQLLGHSLPLALIASASCAPHMRIDKKNNSDLSDEEFVNILRKMNGTPEILLQNRELMELVVPFLRADFRLSDNYMSDKVKINCPIYVFGGTHDVGIPLDHLQKWREVSSCKVEVTLIEGDHYFIESNHSTILSHVNIIIESLTYNTQ